MNLALLRLAEAAATAVVVAGCATTTGAAHRSGPTDTASAASRSQTTASGTSPSSAASSSRRAPASCGALPLGVSTASVEGAAGSRYLTVRLSNEGGSSCRMVGYPGVSIVAGDRSSQIGAAAERDPSVQPVPVVLAPRTDTTFVLRVTQALNYPATTCQPQDAYGYRIYPPGSRTTLFLADPDLKGCANPAVRLMVVRPVGTPAA